MLYELVPRNMLPKDYGGSEESIDEFSGNIF